MELSIDRFQTPLGELAVVADDAGTLYAVDWTEHGDRMAGLVERYHGTVRLRPASDPAGLTSRLRDYFGGNRTAIEGLRVAETGTPFQRRVWAALRDIPWGQTISYGELARRVGASAAVRAVGRANGANPVSIVVPCHRVIGANGTLTGYGGGMHRKEWLIAHERGSEPDLWSFKRAPTT